MAKVVPAYLLSIRILKGCYGHVNKIDFFTTRCYAQHGIATASRLSVCLSVRDVEVSYRLKIFRNNFTVRSLSADPNITDLLQGEHTQMLAGVGEEVMEKRPSACKSSNNL